MRQETQVMLTDVANGLIRVASMIRTETHEILSDGDHIAVIKHWAQIRQAKETIKSAREAIEEIEERLSKDQIPELARQLKDRTGVKPPFKIEGIGSVTISQRFTASIIDDPQRGKEVGYDWLRNNDAGSLVTETVNASTLSAYAKDMLMNNGIELPPEIFKVGMSPYTSIRK